MKRCTKCLQEKTEADFYLNKGKPMSSCKECVKSAVRTWYADTRPERSAYERARTATPVRKSYLTEASRKHRKRNPSKYAARMAVSNALRDGRLARGACERCGTTKRVQAHHAAYSKPLEVTWECFKCHRENEHGQVVTAENDGRGKKESIAA